MNWDRKINFSILLLGLFIVFSIIYNFVFKADDTYVLKVISPKDFVVTNQKSFVLDNYDTFDSEYTEHNRVLASILKLNEDEAFIIGNLGKYWAKNILENRRVKIISDNFLCHKFEYKTRFENSAYCIKDASPCNKYRFEKQLNTIRRGQFVILDLDTDFYYPVTKENREKVKNYVVVRKSHIKNYAPKQIKFAEVEPLRNYNFTEDNFKIIVSDLTTKLKPDRNCSSDICKEVLKNINSAKKTVDMAIYGYSSTPEIENAVRNAKARGVKFRLVYDIDSKGENIYPNTFEFTKLIPENRSDKESNEIRNTMHNKFYIFDNQTVITGSANLSHTDMSGYNSNSIIVIKNPQIAEYYTQEFEQMYNGKFHNDKISTPAKKAGNISIYFSPQDKGIKNGVLPLIKNAKKYIYIPAFVITEKRITQELINAKRRGVDVRVIADALNASTLHSKHKELRASGVQVKAENYAGKMHSKSMIIDDEYLIIGSMNFSNSGENRNDENMVVLYSPDGAKFYKQFFLYQWDKIPEKWLKYTPRAEGKDSIGSCSDGIDNNYDGYTDMEDEACRKLL